MTIGGWILFGTIALVILIFAAIIAWYWSDEGVGPISWIVSIGIAAVLCIVAFVGIKISRIKF